MRKKRISTTIKQSFRKLKYLDKTQANYFIVMSFLLAFCLFTGGTYSYFTFSKHLNAATITIAKLGYNLSSTTSGYSNGNITVAAGQTLMLDLTLESQNSVQTKYALKYSANSNVKVYYSENLKNNMTGVIGTRGSTITMRVVIVNDGTTSQTVNFTIAGGYLQNTLETNITEGYYEDDIIIRTILLDENAENRVIEEDFPAQDSDYAYVTTVCTEPVLASWDNDNWNLNLDIQNRVSCDVYFKKMTTDVEVLIATKGYSLTFLPNDTSEYGSASWECNNGATATWDEANQKLNITNMKDKTLCIGLVKE